MKRKEKKWLLASSGLLLASAYVYARQHRKMIPNGVKAVFPFDAARYLGRWNEIARLDYRFEKNLERVTAEYLLNADGSIRVVNRGFNAAKNKWEQYAGKAKFRGDETVAELQVSFFGPFYAGYNVIALTPDYRHAMVCGDSRSYLWILSRDTTMPYFILEPFLRHAGELGFETGNLVWPKV